MAIVTETPKTNGNGLANDVAKIRDILFGEQANQMDERILSLESAINSLRQENSRLRQALEAEVTSRSRANDAIVESMGVEKTVVNTAISEATSKIEKQLFTHANSQQTQLNDLINTLAGHLVAQQAEQNKQIAGLQAVLQSSGQAQELLANSLLKSLNTTK